jgi:hypothetical protein
MTLARRFAQLALAAAAVASLAFLPQSATAQPAATFLAAIGDVQVFDAAGQARPGERGGALSPGDRILIGAGGLAQLRFSDGGMLSLRANSELRIDAYAYRGERDAAANSVLQLLKGGLRAITGAIARLNRSEYRVVTATATIGVRGTDFEAFHVPTAVPGGEAPPGEPGTYLKVNQGIAFLQTQGGSVDVLPEQVAFVPRANVVPSLLQQVPQFLRGQPPAPTPRTQPQRRSEEPSRPPGALTAPSRTLTAPTTSPTLNSPTWTSPTLSPELTAPTTTSPTLSPNITSPTMTSPTLSPSITSPTTTSPTLSPSITSPTTTSPTLSPSITSPATTSPMLSPSMTAPTTSPTMTAPR